MQAAFVGRSEYFRALFRDHFRETSRTDVCDKAIKQTEEMEGKSEIDLLTLRDVTPEVTFCKASHKKIQVTLNNIIYITGVYTSGLLRLL